jgi:hypothetical protein
MCPHYRQTLIITGIIIPAIGKGRVSFPKPRKGKLMRKRPGVTIPFNGMNGVSLSGFTAPLMIQGMTAAMTIALMKKARG